MKRKKFAFAAAVVLIVILMAVQVKASPGPTIALNPSSVRDLEPGASFTVDVMIEAADNLYGWQINLTFTPGVLSVTEVTEGPFLKDVEETAWPTPQIRNEKGYVFFSSSLWVPYPPQGVSGNGVLGTINFKVESGGSTSLHFDTGGTYLRTVIGGNPYPIADVSLQDGSYTGVGGGGLQFPLEVIVGAVIAVLVVVIVVVFILKRRRQ